MAQSPSRRRESRHQAREQITSSRSSNDRRQLPPLSEAIPEIRQTYSASDHLSHFSHPGHEPLRGPSQFPEARSLAPLPLASRSQLLQQRSNHESAYCRDIQANSLSAYPVAESSGSSYSSDFSGRRLSLSSSSTSASRISVTTRGSPAPPSILGTQTSSRAGSVERAVHEEYRLPSISKDKVHSYPADSSLARANRNDKVPLYAGASSGYQASSPMHAPYQSYSSTQPHLYSCPSGQQLGLSSFYNAHERGSYGVSLDNAAEFGEGTHKRRRGNLPKNVTDILRAWFSEHIAHPYPTEDEKQLLMGRTGLTISQISNWFINARRRSLPQMTKQAQAEAELRDSQGNRHR